MVNVASSVQSVAFPHSHDVSVDLCTSSADILAGAPKTGLRRRAISSVRGLFAIKSHRQNCTWCGETEQYDADLETCFGCEVF
jgi:hypothetical protein